MAIAVVDGFSTGAVLSGRLASAGVRLLHVRSSDYAPKALTRGFRASDYERDLGYVGEFDLLVDVLRRADVRQVVAGMESGVILADRLNLRLGTPANSADGITARRDKSVMARAARASGVATPLGEAFDTPDAAVAWFVANGLDEAVVKPATSAGTDNVRFCTDPDGVRAACARVLGAEDLFGTANRHVIVQERVRGTEYYFNTVSYDGLHRTAEIWRYTKRLGPGGAPVYDFEEPVDARAPEVALLRPFVLDVLDALGIRTAAAHVEVMSTARGPVLIECGARLGGGTLPAVVARFSGISQTELFARTLLAPSSLAGFDDGGVRWSEQVRNVALINHRPGLVRSDSWLSSIERLPTFVAASAYLPVGSHVPLTVDMLTSPGFVYLASDDPERVDRDYRRLRELECAELYTGGVVDHARR